MKRVALMILMTCIVVMSVQAKVYLVAVGIDDNSHNGCSTLKTCVNDVNIIDWVYKKNGEKSKSRKAVTLVLLDSRATASNVEQAMTKLYARAGKNDQVVFFFSGHGGTGDIVCYDKTLSYDRVRAAMAKSKSKQKIIYIDACMSGSLRQQAGTSQRRFNDSNVMLFMSSRNSETSGAGDGDFKKNSTFTRYLQRGLKGGADLNKDRRITARELFKFVNEGVKTETYGSQNPVMWGKFDNNMVVMSWAKKNN